MVSEIPASSRTEFWNQIAGTSDVLHRHLRLEANKDLRKKLLSLEEQKKIIENLQALADFDVKHKTRYGQNAIQKLNLQFSRKRLLKFVLSEKGQEDIINRLKELIDFDIKYNQDFAFEALEKITVSPSLSAMGNWPSPESINF